MLIKNEKFVLFSFAGFLLIALSFKGIDKVLIPNDSINRTSISSDTIIPDSNKTEKPVYIDPLSYDTTNLFSRCWNTRSTVSYSSERKKGYSDSTFITLLDADTSWAFPVDDKIVSKFGYRGRNHFHKGLDVHLRRGQEVKAVFPGKVRYARYNSGGYGYLVIIRHYNGTETYYAHLSKLLVSSNQEVKAGDVIGLGGNTGASSGPHLHFEIRLEDKAINPEKIFNLNTKCLVVNKLVLSKDIFSARGKVSSVSSRTKFENSDKEGIFRHCDHGHHSLKKVTPKVTEISNPVIAKKKTELIKKNTVSSKKNSSVKSQSKKTSNSLAKYHFTKKGDCIYSIARKHGVSVNTIYRYNNLSSNSILRVNQKIRVR